MKGRNSLVAAGFAVMWVMAQASIANVWYVSTSGSDGGAGTTNSPWLTITNAITNAAATDEIRVGSGTYTQNVLIPAGKDSLVLKGSYDTNDWTSAPSNFTTTIRATTTANDALTVSARFCMISGFRITGARYGINLAGRSNGVEYCLMETNTEGVYITAHSNVLSQCIFRNNTNGIRSSAGEIGLFGLFRCYVTNNSNRGITVQGGGQFMCVDARNSLIAKNGGHGFYTDSNDNAMYGNHFSNCTIADNGGSGYFDNSTSLSFSYLTNTIISGNAQYGLRRNASGVYGRGLYMGGSAFYNNTSGNVSQVDEGKIVDQGGIMLVDPKQAGPGDYHLQGGSPCIDAGADLSWAGTIDLEGTSRSAPFDIGCYQSANAPAAKFAATYVAASRPDDSGAGTDWSTAKKTLGAALAITTDGGTCNVASGTYPERVFLPVGTILQGTNRLSTVITNVETIRTPVTNAGGYTVSFSGTNTILREITVAGGYFGINITGRSNRVERCIVENCSLGGIYIGGLGHGNVLDQCTVRNNSNGVYCGNPGEFGRFVLDHCFVTNNAGRGINILSGNYMSMDARNSLIANNGGHGFYSEINDNALYGNRFFNCTIASNGGSGFFDNHNGPPITWMTNCIVAGNAQYGIRRNASGDYSSLRPFNMGYDCIYNNASGNVSQVDNGRIVDQGGLLFTDPVFTGGGDYHLQSGSLCIDGGLDLMWAGLTNDLDGGARSAPFDMGCYQSANPPGIKYAATYADASRPDDTGAGTNAATAKKMIGSALAYTTNGGTCNVASGIYSERIALPDNAIVQGTNALTTIITNSGGYGVSFSGTNSVMRDITVSGGYYGINLVGRSNRVERCIVENCSPGGIYIGVQGHGNVLYQCIIRNNSNGVYCSPPSEFGRFELNRCFVTNNIDRGITILSGNYLSMDARNSLIANNGGHGFYSEINDNALYGNRFFYCTIARNGGSGFFDNMNGPPITWMTNCIVAHNAQYGIRRNAGTDYNSLRPFNLGYSCIYSNASGDISTNSNGQVIYQGGLITNQPPLFYRSGYTLSDQSPCLDVASDIGITNDIVGTLRPVTGRKPPSGSLFDMGCYEMIPIVRGTVFVVH